MENEKEEGRRTKIVEEARAHGLSSFANCLTWQTGVVLKEAVTESFMSLCKLFNVFWKYITFFEIVFLAAG